MKWHYFWQMLILWVLSFAFFTIWEKSANLIVTKFNTRHMHIHKKQNSSCCSICYNFRRSFSSLGVFCLILSISLPLHHSHCPNCPLLLNSSKSHLCSCQTFHLLVVCTCLCLLLFTIKLFILLLLFWSQSYLYILPNRKIAKFNTLQLYLSLKIPKLNTHEVWLMIFHKI